MGWEEKRLFLVLIIWMKMLIFLLWCVKKKKKKKETFQESCTSENTGLDWIASADGVNPLAWGDSDDLLHLGTPGSGSLRVPLFLLLSLWEFQMWGQLKKEVIWSWGSYSLIGAVREGQRGQGRAEGAGRPLISPHLPFSLNAWAACPIGVVTLHISEVLILWWLEWFMI